MLPAAGHGLQCIGTDRIHDATFSLALDLAPAAAKPVLMGPQVHNYLAEVVDGAVS